MSPVADSPVEGTLTLLAFLTRVQAKVASVPAAWVEAEIVSINDRSGVMYIKLADRDKTTATTYKSDAVLFASHRNQVLTKFEKGTGEALHVGHQVRLFMTAQLTPRYGFQVVLTDIDPTFTLGEMEQNLRAIRETLQAKGVFGRNRESFPAPDDFFHVGVITPDNAASLADFREVADRLEYAGLCRFTYRTGVFQGSTAGASIVGAMKAILDIHRSGDSVCAVCLVRGGGSATELADLNNFLLASAVCQARYPVFTGIGHATDSTILDEVAHRSFDTPSKVAHHILTTIANRAREAEKDWRAIQSCASRRIEREGHWLSRAQSAIVLRSQSKLAIARDEVDADRAAFRATEKRVSAAQTEIQVNYQLIISAAGNVHSAASRELQGEWLNLRRAVRSQINQSREGIITDMATVSGLSTTHTLKRGFTIIRTATGIPITRKIQIKTGTNLSIEFADGTMTVRPVTEREEG